MIQRLAILGFGDVEVSPKLSATLSNFFADRPIEILCWDPNEEACDAMCRVLRLFLKERSLKYPVTRLLQGQTWDEVDALIVCGDPEAYIETDMMIPIFRVPSGEHDRLDMYKFQALRWINKEDDPLEFMSDAQIPELLDWLNSF